MTATDAAPAPRPRLRINPIRTRLWRAMRILRDFTIGDIVAVCEMTSRASVTTFFFELRRAGYLLKRTSPRRPSRFRLLRDTGPNCPVFVRCRHAMWDPNNAQEYPLEH